MCWCHVNLRRWTIRQSMILTHLQWFLSLLRELAKVPNTHVHALTGTSTPTTHKHSGTVSLSHTETHLTPFAYNHYYKLSITGKCYKTEVNHNQVSTYSLVGGVVYKNNLYILWDLYCIESFSVVYFILCDQLYNNSDCNTTRRNYQLWFKLLLWMRMLLLSRSLWLS